MPSTAPGEMARGLEIGRQHQIRKMALPKKKFTEILQNEGLPAAIRWLNSQVPYRYTAVYAFIGDILRNICLTDKENPELTRFPDCSIGDSYCTYIRQSGRRFSVERSLTDSRVVGHPKRESFQCYYGLPLFGEDGSVLGTVCHFDTVPIRVTDEVASLLDDVAPLIAQKAFE